MHPKVVKGACRPVGAIKQADSQKLILGARTEASPSSHLKVLKMVDLVGLAWSAD